MIELENLFLKYKVLNNPTLKNISLNIKNGEKILIVGVSGSGKSTLGKLFNGLIPNSYKAEIQGFGQINGEDFGGLSIFHLSKSIGTIMQDQDSQFVGLNTKEDIAFYLENINMDTKEMRKRVEQVLNLLKIEEIKDFEPKELSGGQKQKVSLAGILVNDVKALLLDEPLANLDPKSSFEIMNLIDRLNKDFGKTIIIIEHRLEDVLAIDFDKIIVFHDGEIIENDSVTNVLKKETLDKIGVRKPLFIEALENGDYDFSNIKNIMDFSEYKNIIIPERTKSKELDKNNEKYNLEVNNLKFSYKKDIPVLDNINFKIKKGEIVGLLGSNGSGKSTLANTILGVNGKYEGTIIVDGEPIEDFNVFHRGNLISCVMQNPNHYITETLVEDEVKYCLLNQGLDSQVIESILEKTLEKCGLLKFRKWPIQMLSYGQRRRVTIASVLVKKPKVIIMDEPTAGQDYNTFKEMLDLVNELAHDGISFIIITHNMQLAFEYCQRVLVLDNGLIKFQGSLSKLFKDEELVDRACLKETSIQRFAKFHNIDEDDFRNLLIGGANECR